MFRKRVPTISLLLMIVMLATAGEETAGTRFTYSLTCRVFELQAEKEYSPPWGGKGFWRLCPRYLQKIKDCASLCDSLMRSQKSASDHLDLKPPNMGSGNQTLVL
ncbi:hypothetical protein STEG23_022670 [Scotinomys teguina]